MKVLSIGNSFSQDAHKWLHEIAENNGVDLQVYNLFIGGCSLESHWKNIEGKNKYYEFELNGENTGKKLSINEALNINKWDVITVQQVSGLSGIYETYEPYLSSILTIIKKSQPDAKIFFHQTWAYEQDSKHVDFVRYNNSQTYMFECIKNASNKVSETFNIRLIPTGKVIQTLRETLPIFDYKNTGNSLCRDGFHLSYDYGRYAAAAVWFHTLTGQKIKNTKLKDFNTEVLEQILSIANEI